MLKSNADISVFVGEWAHGSGFSSIGKQQRKVTNERIAWQTKTDRIAFWYDCTATSRRCGSSVGIIAVECLVNNVVKGYNGLGVCYFSTHLMLRII